MFQTKWYNLLNHILIFFIYRDLKPANILLHNEEAKISDFGFSKVVEVEMGCSMMQSYVGSP